MLICFLKKVYWASSVTTSSFLGYIKLKKISEIVDNKKWISSFYNKKILIVGTGPSLDNVNENYFLNFDAIIYINHAIKCSGKVEDEYFFSTDVNVVKGISNKPYYEKIQKIGSEKSILAPIFFQQVFFIKKEFKERFSWIIASQAAYRIHKMNKSFFGFHMPVTAVYWPKQPETNELEFWFAQQNQVTFFPVIESTSALSAILFVAKYSPEHISLIGCDFNAGRSQAIVDNCPDTILNIFSEAIEKFYFLKNFLEKRKITLHNNSWN